MRIARLLIERFRGIEFLMWDPSAGVNCIVGPADAGKTTVLAAIELLLAPWQPVLFEFDYWRRRVADGFSIRAVIVDLPPEFISSFRVPPLHGWRGDQLVDLPEPGALPAMVACARGLDDLELEHVLIDASDAENRFSVRQRRDLMTTRLQWDRTDAELRLGRGSLLQEHLGGDAMRSALTGALADASARLAVPLEVADRVKALGDRYAKEGLPHELCLGLQSPRRESLMGMLGLLQGSAHADAVPLALAGTGTKRFAAFELAAMMRADAHIALLDEPEVGLEPYRQRRLVARLRELIGTRGQAFLTTHSPAVLGALRSQELARLAGPSAPACFPAVLDQLLDDDPEAMLARMPILCEGPTEAGMLSALLPHVAGLAGPSELDARGVRLVQRRGQPAILRESLALAEAGVRHGVFADKEAPHVGLRDQVGLHANVVLGTWVDVCNLEEAVAKSLPVADVALLLDLVVSLDPWQSLEDLHQAICDRAGSPGRRSFEALVAEIGADAARAGLAQAMNKHKSGWFKTEAKASALGRFLIERGLPDRIKQVVATFWDGLKPLVFP